MPPSTEEYPASIVDDADGGNADSHRLSASEAVRMGTRAALHRRRANLGARNIRSSDVGAATLPGE